MTALVIIISGQWQSGLDGAPLTSSAFNHFLPGLGQLIVSLGLALFAYSTLISWYYYGEKGIEYLLGHRVITPYKWVYLAAIPIGAVVKLEIVWGFADIANGFMALPNLIAILGLSGVVYAGATDYYRRRLG
jgi:AGCS family alanine or glycine:cation symporter